MPQKRNNSLSYGNKLGDEIRNEAIDQCTHALIQKLDVEKIAEVIENWIKFIEDIYMEPNNDESYHNLMRIHKLKLVLSIKKYLTKEAV